MTLTDEVRAFNRFYTREIGLLNRSLPATDLSLPEARVLYELAQAPEGGRTAAEIGRTLNMDKAHLSRVVARFLARGCWRAAESARTIASTGLISLTDAGEKSSREPRPPPGRQVDALLEPVDAAGRNRIIEAMRDIRMALRDREAPDGEVSLRPLRPGDVGWIIHRQTVLYTQEYGWDWTYEGLASRILGAFVAEFDPVPRRRLGRRARRRDRRLDFPDEERRSSGRETQAALCRAKRPRRRRRAQAGRHVHRPRARARLPRAYPRGPTTFWSPRAASIRRRGSASSAKSRIIRSAMISSGRPGRSIWTDGARRSSQRPEFPPPSRVTKRPSSLNPSSPWRLGGLTERRTPKRASRSTSA